MARANEQDALDAFRRAKRMLNEHNAEVPPASSAFGEFYGKAENVYNNLNLGQMFKGKVPVPEMYLSLRKRPGVSFDQPEGLSAGVRPGQVGVFYKKRF